MIANKSPFRRELATLLRWALRACTGETEDCRTGATSLRGDSGIHLGSYARIEMDPAVSPTARTGETEDCYTGARRDSGIHLHPS